MRFRRKANPFVNTTLWSALWLTLFYFAYGSFDPFGAKQAAAGQSEAVLNRLFSGPRYASQAQDQITVILLDDSFVEQQRDRWPLSYNTQEWLLSSIARLEPKAIYLDFLYRRPHHPAESIEQFEKKLNRISETIPIFVPLLVNSDRIPSSCVPENVVPDDFDLVHVVDEQSVMDKIRTSNVDFTYIGWNNCGNKYPAQLYRHPDLPTPAFALFSEVCRRDRSYSPSCESISEPGAYREPMHIVWGTGVSERHLLAAEATGTPCAYIDKSSSLSIISYQVGQLAKMAGQIFSHSNERGISEACTYSDTLHAMWFDSTDPKVRQHIKELVKDRIVLVGAKIDGVPDSIVSPVNGQVPGVYLFAMALDNYLQYGSEYYKSATIDGGYWLEATIFFVIVFLVTAWWRAVVALYYPYPLVDPKLGDWVNILGWVVFSRFVIPMLLGLALVLWFWKYDRLPLDWISLVGLAFITSPVSMAECLRERPAAVLWKSLKRRFSG